ncbi:DedA family protein [Coralloluteibacterium stylophorae]|uniref:DedA family protein n=1 Tax=Coralloluteibacterium stylophorae TaxID=1776034 RepID=A0A8J8AYB7_9GAMM|nr:DedA family protein [Coralloluteibacterium stylophorae]MBS7457037.1 DedA family protein [Coralloluteibacterium stylophorae]
MDILSLLVDFFSDYGYLAVFLILLACGFGVPIPEDVTLVAGGIISGLGYANVHLMFGVCMVGVLLGDSTMFLIGRHFGVRALRWRWVNWLLTPARYARVQQKFERYGTRLLFIARFLPGLRSPIFLTAGMTRRVSYLKFLMLDGLAALISVPIWVYLGDYGADNHEWLLLWLKRGQTGLYVVLGVVGLAIVWYLVRKHLRRRSLRRRRTRQA